MCANVRVSVYVEVWAGVRVAVWFRVFMACDVSIGSEAVIGKRGS